MPLALRVASVGTTAAAGGGGKLVEYWDTHRHRTNDFNGTVHHFLYLLPKQH